MNVFDIHVNAPMYLNDIAMCFIYYTLNGLIKLLPNGKLCLSYLLVLVLKDACSL